MGIAKLGFSGLKYLFGKSAKNVTKTAEKIAPKIQKDVLSQSKSRWNLLNKQVCMTRIIRILFTGYSKSLIKVSP